MKQEVRIQFEGREVLGWWEREPPRGIVVSSGFRRKATQIGDSDPETVARRLLRELAQEANDKP